MPENLFWKMRGLKKKREKDEEKRQIFLVCLRDPRNILVFNKRQIP